MLVAWVAWHEPADGSKQRRAPGQQAYNSHLQTEAKAVSLELQLQASSPPTINQNEDIFVVCINFPTLVDEDQKIVICLNQPSSPAQGGATSGWHMSSLFAGA